MNQENFLLLLNELKDSSGIQKEAIIKKISELLEKEQSRNLSGYIYRLLELVSRKGPLDLITILNSEYSSLRIAPYKDTDNLYKVALGITFLSDDLNSDKEYYKDIAIQILRELKSRGIDEIFNDISINTVQFRNSELL